jgi:Protein of unknown function (DUF3866)
MLKLRRATVIEADPSAEELSARLTSRDRAAREQTLVVELAGSGGEGAPRRRRAIADLGMVGASQVGDELIVNVEALDLGLGSGGFDVVHTNLTRGLDFQSEEGAGAMKLNYTSIQHSIAPVDDESLALPLERPAAVLALHGQLAPLAWSFAQEAPGCRLGYVQTEGGALPASHSSAARVLRERGLLAGHLTAGAAYGGEGEALTTAGALHHGLITLGWDAAVCGPGPGIVGSATPLGHGGMQALDSAHVALALGCATLLVARISSGDERLRHRGISHHTLTVLDLLLEPVTVALPAGMRTPVGSELRAGLGSMFAKSRRGRRAPAAEIEVERPARITRHDWRRARVDLAGYASSGLPAETMGRGLAQDPLFFAAALAGGSTLAELRLEGSQGDREEGAVEGAL